ncbi:MAG: hypothetical protein ABJC89_11465 [Acidobacteriota bacterium]
MVMSAGPPVRDTAALQAPAEAADQVSSGSSAAGNLAAESQPSAAAPPALTSSPDSTDDLPVSLDRIQRALSRPPAIRLKTDRIVFRVEVLGRKMSIEDILGPDYLKGPVPSSGMSHQEFLNMVTPKDYQGYAAFSNGEGMSVAATSFALQWALQKAIHKFESAKQDREREAARKEVQDALLELERARARAGLPPK